MGFLLRARTWAQGVWERRQQAQAAIRVAFLRAGVLVQSLPETVREQIRHWRGIQVEFSVAEQRELLAQYYDRFEQLAELICDAAFAGEGEPFQQQYTELRRWLQRAYPPLKPYITAHMNLEPSDAEFGMRVCGTPTDAMEALFVAETLDEILRHDEGALIGRLERARSALYRYGDYLRQFA
ncbi:MAG: hypothetical protein P3X24_008805 [bacterium]|nr:hypothetical protein [bacterium]